VICASPLIFYLAGSKAIRGVEVLLNCFSARIMPFILSEPGRGFKGILGIVLGFRFLVKFPQFAIHIWLPKAHVEAPVYGSIELAGILLKLGVVG